MSEIGIRKADPADAETLITLSRRTISQCYRPFLGDQAVDGFIGSGAVDSYVRDNLPTCTLVLCDGRVAGFAVCRDDLLDLMMVDVDFHRQGLGTALLQHAEKTIFEEHRDARLESFEGNGAANAFYRKNGWREARRFPDSASGSTKIEFRKSRPSVEEGTR